MPKYHNVPTVIGGTRFASRAEARRYEELRILLAAGEIRDLRLQPRYVLQPKFRDRYGKNQRAIFYVGDFAYREIETGLDVCEDVKGTETAVFKLKRIMMLRLYPEIDFRVVKM